ncbi:hypothetical protein SCHPADRAFT_849726 [Schizopora paradoxa]|uniref:PARP catalytic domain-containing protein n=1 Tax=Schizopora paradoxa TaxID=27342 RepID=A0A0H2RT88_9AGAM|nr:hypothetical protein SCHPADRAFT_849726 [Schizopora paradoxa]
MNFFKNGKNSRTSPSSGTLGQSGFQAYPTKTYTGNAGNGFQNEDDFVDLCEVCGTRPKFVDNNTGRRHPYCGRTCASKDVRRDQPQNGNPLYSSSNRTRSEIWVKVSKCRMSECQREPLNQFSGFCGEDHKQAAVRRGLVALCSKCNKYLQTSGSLCVACQKYQDACQLTEVRYGSHSFNEVARVFSRQWKSESRGQRAPTVEKVLRVENSRKTLISFDYFRKDRVVDYTTFHSSQCICDLGKDAPYKFCQYPSCGICMATKSSFTKFAFDVVQNSGSLGDGVYSYLHSSSAHRHSTACTSSPFRVMIMCKVVVEKAKSGQPVMGTNSAVMSDTIVVRDSARIIPTNIILYSL